MTRPFLVLRALVAAGLLSAFLTPPTAAAQAQAGAIAGVVRDTSGGVLPGVTVEASSPVLIEKVRTATSDAQGAYRIVELRPGTYTVTFTLPGFSVVKREGVDLTSGFTANINADLAVGSLEETVTVTGASPVVDIQNVRQQTVLSRELLDNLPTNKSFSGYAALTLGATGAAGGAQADTGGTFGVHGTRSNDSKITTDGMQVATTGSTGTGASYYNSMNAGLIQETVLQTGGITAEAMSGGVQINIIPKDGGNVISSYFNVNGTRPEFTSENLTDEVRARGLNQVGDIKMNYDVGGTLGGPIKQDKLWFIGSSRRWISQSYFPGNFFNKNQGKYMGGANTYFGIPHSGVSLYEPDLTRPAYSENRNWSSSVRLTWQATSKQKIALSNGWDGLLRAFSADTAPEGDSYGYHRPIFSHQVTWSYPATNRLLLEAGAVRTFERSPTARPPGVSEFDIAITELSTGYKYNAKVPTATISSLSTNYSCPCKNFIVSSQKFAASFITGSHAFKTGVNIQENWNHDGPTLNYPPVMYNLRNGVPESIQEYAELEGMIYILPDVGLFAQDQWTMNKMTLNVGVRFNYYNAVVPAQHTEEKTFVKGADMPAANGVPVWKDLDPRMGLAYDVFGNGKTAVKTSIGRYVGLYPVNGFPRDNVPGRRITTSVTRTWADANRDYVPDCILQNPEANGECGRASDLSIGQPRASTTFADDTIKDNRGYNWQGQVSVQQELRPGVALNVGYFRTWYGNFTVSSNRALTAADFDSYCVTAPTDTRLGATSGQQLCGFFDVKPAKFGIVDTLVSQTSNFGKQTESYQGVDIGMNARLPRGINIQGGMSTGTTITDNCEVARNNPSAEITVFGGGKGATVGDDFCHVVQGMDAQIQYKFAGNLPLPWGLQTSTVIQNLPGTPISARQSIRSAAIAPSLGRNLSAGANASVQTSLLIPYTEFESRVTQVDVRLTKRIQVGKARFQGQVDLYNILNAGTITNEVPTYGPTWKNVLAVQQPRLLKLGAQFDW